MALIPQACQKQILRFHLPLAFDKIYDIFSAHSMAGPESARQTQEKAYALMEEVLSHSWELANGNLQSDASLLPALVPEGPDQGPEIPITPELLQFLTPRRRLALTIARDWCAMFNGNFGSGTNAGDLLTWEDPHLQQFFTNLGKTIQGITYPNGPFAVAVVDHMVGTNEAFHQLLLWAEKQLTAK